MNCTKFSNDYIFHQSILDWLSISYHCFCINNSASSLPFIFSIYILSIPYRSDNHLINCLFYFTFYGNTYRKITGNFTITFSRWFLLFILSLIFLMLSYRTVYIKQYIGNTPFSFVVSLLYTNQAQESIVFNKIILFCICCTIKLI